MPSSLSKGNVAKPATKVAVAKAAGKQAENPSKTKPQVKEPTKAKSKGRTGTKGKAEAKVVKEKNASKGVADRPLWETAIQRDWEATLQGAPEEVLADQALILQAVDQSWRAITYASEELLTNHDILMAAAKQTWWAFEYSPEELAEDKIIAKEAIKQCWRALGNSSKQVRRDKELVLMAIEQDGDALGFASKSLRSDREVVFAAVTRSGTALRFAAESLLADRELVLEAVKTDAAALALGGEVFLTISFRVDNVDFDTLSLDASLLSACTEALAKAIALEGGVKLDIVRVVLSCPEELVVEHGDEDPDDEGAQEEGGQSAGTEAAQAVATDASEDEASAAATDEASDSEDEFLEAADAAADGEEAAADAAADGEEAAASGEDAMSGGVEVVASAGGGKGQDPEPIIAPRRTFFLVEATISSTTACKPISEVHSVFEEESITAAVAAWLAQVTGWEDIAMGELVFSDFTCELLRAEFRSDRAFVLDAVRLNGLALSYAAEEMREDKAIVREACTKNGEALELASEDLRDTFSIAVIAVKQCGKALRHASEDLQADRDVVLDAVRQDGVALAYASEEVRKDKEVVLEAIRQTWKAARFAVQVTTEAAIEAVRQDWRAAEDLLNIPYPLSQDQVEELTAANPRTVQAWRLRENREAVLAALRVDGLVLRFVDPVLRADYEVIREAMQQNPDALWEAHPGVRQDRELQSLYASGPMRGRRVKLREEEVRWATAMRESAGADEEALDSLGEVIADALEEEEN